jgi:PKD repeat protein
VQHPSHTFEIPGTYSVKLVVENDSSSDTLVKVNYINVLPGSTSMDLIAFYPFNGNADDESGNGHHGSVHGSMLTHDRFGTALSAYYFDGDNDYIESTIGSYDTLAVSFWYKAPYPDKYYPTFFSYFPTGFVGQYGGTLSPPYTPGDVYCAPAQSGLQNLPIPEFDTWHHVYIDIDNIGHTQMVYVDGQFDNIYTDINSLFSGNDFHMGVGDPAGNPSQYFTGTLDDFRIYGRRLNEEEIIELYDELVIPQPEICIVTVDDASGENMVVWEKEETSEIESYLIYRESTQANVFELIGEVPYSDSSYFIDENSIPSQRAYKYKISALTEADNETRLSNYHKTMHLNINVGPIGMNLIWDQYEGFDFNTYYIYKGSSPETLELIDSISSNFTSYTDVYPPWGNMYYMIEVVNPNGCDPGRDNYFSRSHSNITLNPTGIEENIMPDLLVYPNPTDTHLTIALDPVWGDEKVTISIVDFTGKEIIEQQIFGLKANLNIPELQSGIYFIRVQNSEYYSVKKIVVY